MENSVDLESLENSDVVCAKLINPLEALNLPVYNLNEIEKERVSHGMPISNDRFENLHVVILVYGGRIYAIGIIKDNQILVKKVFEVL